jgi:hypothetical protein
MAALPGSIGSQLVQAPIPQVRLGADQQHPAVPGWYYRTAPGATQPWQLLALTHYNHHQQ